MPRKIDLSKKTLPQLVKRRDELFSRWYRLAASVEGYCQCYTCGKALQVVEAQAGHLFSRGRLATRWDPDNVKIQCMRCNVFLKGNYDEYHPKIIESLGLEQYQALERKSRQSVKIPKAEHIAEIERLAIAIKTLEANQ